jgi:DNA-binding GntR family transcriptional regulator
MVRARREYLVSAMPGPGPACRFVLVGYWLADWRDTRSDQIAELLRERVIEAHYPVGSQLSGAALADELNATQAVVRGALRVLGREGLLVPVRGGAQVRVGSRPLAVAASEFRGALDALAARLASATASQTLRAQLDACVGEFRRATASGDVHAAGWADIAFHLSILDASANQLLIGQRPVVASTLRGIRPIYLDAAERIAVEHETILTAVVAGDADAAERAAWAHGSADVSRLVASSSRVRGPGE